MTKVLANFQGKVFKTTNGGVFLAPEGSSSHEISTYNVKWVDFCLWLD